MAGEGNPGVPDMDDLTDGEWSAWDVVGDGFENSG